MMQSLILALCAPPVNHALFVMCPACHFLLVNLAHAFQP